jgi:leucine-zipper of insertion element IS481
MLVELSVMEQRCHLVMEVVSETPVTEVACRYGVSRQAVHLWLGKYRRAGPPGMADHSRRPHFSSTPASPARVAHRRDQERVVEVVAVTFLFVACGAAVPAAPGRRSACPWFRRLSRRGRGVCRGRRPGWHSATVEANSSVSPGARSSLLEYGEDDSAENP